MEMKFLTTYGDGRQEYSELEFVNDIDEIENEVVNLYPEAKHQKIEGFGGAITDAAAYVYAQMSEEQKAQLIEQYFSPEKMKYGMVRIHMDSCDFATEMYEAMSDKDDTELVSFSFERTEKYILPMLVDAQKTAGKQLQLMLSPWSPPSFMKTNGKRVDGGSLKTEYYGMWARYICRYIKEFQDRGFCVKRISLQNEAKAVQTWDSCVYTAEQEKIFLRDFMYPELQKNDMKEVEVFIWDHNKERIYERAMQTIDDSTKSMVDGIAFHWYSGDHFEALALVQKAFPKLKLIISESCIEYTKFGAKDQLKNAQRLSHEIIGDLNHGMCAFYDWNLLLDETGGPNHVGNLCHAPFLYDREKKELIPQLIAQYFYHFSHYIEAEAIRIAATKYTDKIDVSAFENTDGSIAVILLNRSDEDIPIVLRMKEKVLKMEVKAGTIVSGRVYTSVH